MAPLWRDLVHAWRSWRRQPVALIAAVLALALGLGANATVFSVVSGVLLRPLPYADPGRLVALWQDRSATGGPRREVFSPGYFVDLDRRATEVRGVAAIRPWGPNLTGRDGAGSDEPERLLGATVTGAYFETLGVAPAIGRTLTRDDDRPGAPTVVVLSDRLWRRRYAADARLVGQSIQLDGQSVEVVGVMPVAFRGAVVDADIWNAMRIDPANAPRGIIMLRAIARLAPAVSLERAQSAFTTLHTQLQQEDPELAGSTANVVRLHDDVVGPVRPVLIVLMGSVVMVLLIACANVTSLILARAAQRRSEMSLRVALGASRGRLIRQVLVEVSLVTGAGALAGLGLAQVGVRALLAIAPPEAPRLQEVRLDAAALIFLVVITILTAVLAAIVPAWVAARSTRLATIREGSRETRALSRVRTLIVVGEVAIAMVLVIGAGLFVRSLNALQQVDLGFRPDRLLTASVSPPRASYRGEEAVRILFDRMIARARELPGVESASMTSVLPLSGMQINFSFRIEGRPPGRTPADEPVASMRSVGQTFFQTMGMTVVEGRGFTADDRAGAPHVAVVNRALVQRYWNGVSPIGGRVNIEGDSTTIVGIVGDVHHAGPAAVPDGEMYVPYGQLGVRAGWLVLRTTRDPSTVIGALRSAMRDVDPSLPLAAVRPMTALVASSVAQPRFLAFLLTWFSGVALVMALIGVYGLLTLSVNQRTREFGIRMAIGATASSVVGLVLRQSLVLVATGVLVGTIAGAALGGVVKALLFGVSPDDPTTIIGLGASVVAAALVASYLPAKRAAATDPAIALRQE